MIGNMILPFLPGFTFSNTIGQTRFHKPHHFDLFDKLPILSVKEKPRRGGECMTKTEKRLCPPKPPEEPELPAWIACDKQMTDKCLVTECTSNYHFSGDKSCTTVSPFPADTDMLRKWPRAIPRKDWLPSKRLVICAKHFEADDIINFDTFTDVMGNEQKNQRTQPKLRDGTVPIISANLTHYVSKASKYDTRKDHNERILQREEDLRKKQTKNGLQKK